MKKIKILFTLQMLVFGLFSQSPKQINYQGVARTSDGIAIAGQTISLKFELHQGSITGTVSFTEQQSVLTNSLGLFSTQIGKVNTTDFNLIDWEAGPFFLEVSIDPAGASSFTSLGTQQLSSVPYALHALSVPASFTNNILSIGSHTFALLTGSAGTTYSAGAGIAINSGSIINTAPDVSVTLTPSTNIGITGTYPNFTVASTPSLSLAGNTLSISGGNSVVISTTITATPLTNITSSGVGTITSSGTNTFDINIPAVVLTPSTNVSVGGSFPNFTLSSTPSLSLLSPNTLSISGGNSVSIAPSLGFSGGVLTVGPNTNTVAIPLGNATSTLVGSGIAAVSPTVGNNFTVTVQTPTFTSSGPSSITGTYPNLTITSPTVPAATPNTTITPVAGGIVSISNPVTNSFAVTVQTPTFTSVGPSSITGTYPNLTLTSPTVPTLITPTVIGSGIAVVSPSVGNSFTVSVPQPTFAYSQATGSLTSGTSSVYATPNLTYTNNVLTSGPSTNSVTIPSAWGLNGNAGTSYTTNFIGTSDNTDLRFKVNNVRAGSIEVSGSTYLGYLTGPSSTVAGANVGIGSNDLSQVSSGVRNIAIGYNNLNSLTTGNRNVAIGGASQLSNLTGGDNVAIGYQTLRNNTAGDFNLALGPNALGNTLSDSNVGLGYGSLGANITGSLNTAVGVLAGNNALGNSNVFVGYKAGFYEAGSNKLYISNSSTSVTPLIYGDFATGKLAINQATATEALDVLGNVRFSGALMPNNSPGTSGHVLTSSGAGSAPIWTTVASSGWGLTGNASTTASINYIGTSDNNPLSFRVNGQAAGRIDHILQNLFLGYLSGLSNLTGANNAAVGTYALWLNTSGGGNAAFGQSALYSNTTGLNNTATGYGALYGNTTGSLNTASGESALYQNVGGVENAAFGRATMYNNNGGSRNSAFGSAALYSNVGGINNTALGHQAGFSSASGSGNVFIGANAGYFETTSNKLWIANSNTTVTPLIYGDFSTNKVAIGNVNATEALDVTGNVKFSGALMPNNTAGTAGQFLTSSGAGAAPVWTTVASASGWNLTGNAATTPSLNFVGTTDNNALNFRVSNTKSGTIDHILANVFFGFQSGSSITSGSLNAGYGHQALKSNSTGGKNTAVGYLALNGNIGGNDNTAVGYSALQANANAIQNTAMGKDALYSNTTGSQNSAFGLGAMLLNVSGNSNVAVGKDVLALKTSGDNNVALGYNAGYNNLIGSSNVFIGYQAGYNETGSNKLIIANSSTSVSPLIYGDFSTGMIGLNTPVLGGVLSIDNQSVTTRDAIHIYNARDQIGAGMPMEIDAVTVGQTYGSNTYGRILRLNNLTQGQIYDFGVGNTGNFFIAAGNNYAPAAFNISTGGNIGIGINSPAYKLDVVGTGGPRARVFSQDGNFAGYLSKNTSREFFAGVQGTYESGGGVNSGYHIFDNTAGAQRMVIDYTGNMGIGNFNPTERLEVAGNIQIPGANNYQYATAKTNYATISAASFASINGMSLDGNGTGNAKWILGGSILNPDQLYGTIQIPNGATITAVTVYVYDLDATYNVSAELVRFNMTSNGISTIGTTNSTSLAPGITTISATGLSSVVDNSNYSYFIQFNTRQADSFLWIRGAKVTYIVDKAD